MTEQIDATNTTEHMADAESTAESATDAVRGVEETHPEYVDFAVDDFPGGLPACLEAIPKEPAEQSVVPVLAELMTMEIPADATQIQSGQSVSASLEIKVNDITLCVTELTSSELLRKVLQVIRDVK